MSGSVWAQRSCFDFFLAWKSPSSVYFKLLFFNQKHSAITATVYQEYRQYTMQRISAGHKLKKHELVLKHKEGKERPLQMKKMLFALFSWFAVAMHSYLFILTFKMNLL